MAANPKHPHLPPGREPGVQSVRTARKLAMALWVVLPVGILSAALLTAIALSSGEPIVLPFAVVLLIVLAVIPARMKRRRTAGSAKHFSISAAPAETRRGDRVSARLEVVAPEEVKGTLRVGLVCTCRYDVEETTPSEDGTTRSRVTKEATAYERWEPAGSSERMQSYTFDIPFDGPFSHEGTCLSFAWSVRAQEDRERRSDPFASQPIWVAP